MEPFAIAVKAFIVNENEEVLLVERRSNDAHAPGAWEIPGGRLDSIIESPFDGVRREVQEEVGLDIDIVHPLMIDHFTRDDGQKITMIIFLCKPKTKDVVLSEEHTDYTWTPIVESKEQLTKFLHECVDRFQSYFSGKS